MMHGVRSDTEPADGVTVDVGDQLRTLYDNHYRSMVKLASFYVDDVGTCEEVVQDAFVSLLSGRRRVAPGREVAYLRSAVLNGARSTLRKRRVRREKQPDAQNRPVAPDAVVMDTLQRDRILALLKRLPPRQADVLTLRYYLDLSEAEIAATLGMAPGTVKSHAHRGLARLAKLMEDER